MDVKWLGTVDYIDSLTLQNQSVEKNKITGRNLILGCEHSSVITLGRRSEGDGEIRSKTHLPVVKVSRGGHATLHSPGQLVIYPILNLRELKLTVRDAICLLEKATQASLKSLGIETHRKHEEPGLYTDKGKIAFLGINVSHGITSHGVSINVSNDLSLFKNIRSCGIENESFDRVASYNDQILTHELFNRWVSEFQELLQKESSCI
ncbi:MAG: lipoyl(octanoyl) transferase LipB [Bdellovibrionales bacterium]|nr:lipoyl(octanoyl) transferase LipB [Bdellovibrionales bacterium]